VNKTNQKLINFTIDADHTDQRIDNYLFSKFRKVPKSLIYRMLRKGAIRVNKKRAKPEYKLQNGDLIRLPHIETEMTVTDKKPSDQAMKVLEKGILYEDEDLLVLNKPAGMASHGGSGITFGVIETMREARPQTKSLELVHRLDKDTSGCLILAKKRSILKELHELLRASNIKKKYLVLVKGKWQGGVRKVDVALIKNQLKSGERMVVADEAGKKSLTTFRPRQIFSMASLLEVDLGTGRTHQIRVHATHIGHPIAGDEKYGDKQFNSIMHKKGLKRLFLHAASLSIYLPSKEKTITVKAPLPKELNEILNTIDS